MSKWLPRLVLVGIGFLLAGSPRAPAQDAPPPDQRPPGRQNQPPRLPPDQEAAGLLHQTYDSLSLMRVWMSSSQAKLPEDDARLADQAEDFYRSASRAYKDRDFRRATLLAVASAEAARGLLGVLHADTTPPANLPAPPEMPAPPAAPADRGNFPPPPRSNQGGEGEAAPAPSPNGGPGAATTPKDMAKDVLRAAYRGLGDAAKTDPGTKTSRLFLDAARRNYDQGRKAYDAGDYGKALDLAAAAEAWSHVGEYLKRAENPNQPAGGRGQGEAAEPPPERP